MRNNRSAAKRTAAFRERFSLDVPILLAPMAGACPPSLSIAVANAGGMGACGALLMNPQAIIDWMAEFRAGSGGPCQLNLWIPDQVRARDLAREATVRRFLAQWGPEVPPDAGDVVPPDFSRQCQALLDAAPTAISSIMGLYPPAYVAEIKRRDIAWFATVTTTAEACAAEVAGADVIVAQGAEAGGHRGAFDVTTAEQEMVGLFALLPQVVDAVSVPVIATGGIADARGAAAALVLGASAVQIGTGLLRSPEAKLNSAWAEALAGLRPERTMITRAFSGRPGRAIATSYALAAAAPDAPSPAPYPVQRGLTALMREAATRAHDVQRMQAWAGQAAGLARAEPAAEAVRRIWEGTQELLDW
jgi:nitronate monooxygenase